MPQNHKRAVCDLTVADRLALYDHVISTMKQQQQEDVLTNQDDLYVDLVSKLQKGKDQLNGAKRNLDWMGGHLVSLSVLLQRRAPAVPRRPWS